MRPTRDQLIQTVRTSPSPEARAMAREWLRFPGTRGDHIVGRLNALGKRRAKDKVARASRKRNRRTK